MAVFSVVLLASTIGMPILNGIAWWLWSRGHTSTLGEWRATILLIGLLSATANTVMFFVWFAFRFATNGAPLAWKAFQVCGNDIAIFLIPLTLAGAAFGKGWPRVLLLGCAVLGFFLWVPVGIL